MKYDAIVIGAGSAGAIIAARLSEDPSRSVLLLEAGPDYPDFSKLPPELKHGYGVDRDLWAKAFGDASTHNWGYHARASSETPNIMVPRGKVVGGSSAVNAQIFLRGVPEDYDDWAVRGNAGWGYRDLLPYLRKIESDPEGGDFHGSDGPIPVRRFPLDEFNPEQSAFLEACSSLGYAYNADANLPDSGGVGPTPMNNPQGIRWSTSLGYLDPARHRLNLTIRPDTAVKRIVVEDGRAKGVIAESGGRDIPSCCRRGVPLRWCLRFAPAAHALRYRTCRSPWRARHPCIERPPRRRREFAGPSAGADDMEHQARPRARPDRSPDTGRIAVHG